MSTASWSSVLSHGNIDYTCRYSIELEVVRPCARLHVVNLGVHVVKDCICSIAKLNIVISEHHDGKSYWNTRMYDGELKT